MAEATRLGRFGVWRSANLVTPELAAGIERLGFGALWLGSSPAGDLAQAEELLDATTGPTKRDNLDTAAAQERYTPEQSSSASPRHYADAVARIAPQIDVRLVLGAGDYCEYAPTIVTVHEFSSRRSNSLVPRGRGVSP